MTKSKPDRMPQPQPQMKFRLIILSLAQITVKMELAPSMTCGMMVMVVTMITEISPPWALNHLLSPSSQSAREKVQEVARRRTTLEIALVVQENWAYEYAITY